MITKIDKKLIAILTLFYALISFINFGNFHTNKASWIGNNSKDHLTITFNKPTSVAKIYYYYGLVSGKYHFNYTTADGQLGTLVDKNLDNFPSHYKWGHLDIIGAPLINSITVDIDQPEVEFKQIALYDSQDNYLTNITLSSSNSGQDITNLVTPSKPEYTDHNWLSSTAFDEIYYVSSAEQYIRGIAPYASVQPPLGELLIAAIFLLLGVSPFSWRLLPNICSILLVPLMYILAKKIFKCSKMATIATILMMCEFMHFTLGRLALLDSMLTLFVFVIYLFMFYYVDNRLKGKDFNKTLKYLYGAGIFLGIAMSTKLNALFSTPAILFWLIYCELIKTRSNFLVTFKKAIHLMFIFMVIPLAVFIISYIPYAIIAQSSNIFSFVINQLQYIYSFNFDGHLNGITYPYSSPWWSWPLLLMPQSVYYWQDSQGYMSSSIALFGNPAIYWFSIIAVPYLVYKCFTKTKNYMLIFICTAVLSEYLPYIMVSRVSFIYYFYSVTPFIILAITYVLKLALNQSNKIYHYVAYTYILACIVLFVLYFPLISGVEVIRSYVVNHLLLLKSWNI